MPPAGVEGHFGTPFLPRFYAGIHGRRSRNGASIGSDPSPNFSTGGYCAGAMARECDVALASRLTARLVGLQHVDKPADRFANERRVLGVGIDLDNVHARR